MSLTINAVRLQKIKTIMKAVMDRPADDRAAFLARACVYDYELLKHVESMLVAENLSEGPAEEPAKPPAARSALSTRQPPVAAKIPAAQVLPRLSPGFRLGAFELIRELGRGGLGQVWIAYDQRLNRQIALQLLSRQFTTDVGRVLRFQREARAASDLNHPNILNIYSMGETLGICFIASEHIPGQPLRCLIGKRELNMQKALEIAGQMASALFSAHHVGVLHGAIKPENVLVRPEGSIKVLGFGLAKLVDPIPAGEIGEAKSRSAEAGSGLALRTTGYMSPEQARGESLDSRSDLFCLGLVLYEMLAGQRPFPGATHSQIIAAIREKEPLPMPATTPLELQTIVSRALAKDRNHRYQSARELLVDLREARDSLMLSTSNPPRRKPNSVQQMLRQMFSLEKVA
jgi:eukaryotic-like serine/threonine-protein kinase